MADVLLTNAAKRFGAIEAVRDLTLEINDGEFLVLLGPTGAGKTTTLRLVAGLERPDRGTVSIGGRDVTAAPPATRDVTFVFQQYSLYPHLSVYDNLAFPLRSPQRALSEERIRARVERVAEMLRITQKLDSRSTRLSGGEMQRVAIGRALVREPAIHLMDEPLSSLDAKLRGDLRIELKHIQQDLGATILFVTHDQVEAMTMATRIGVLDGGRLVQVGTPREVYERPANTHVAARLGVPGINLLPADAVPANRLLPGTHTVGARSEHVRLRPAAGGSAVGSVTRIEHLGGQIHVRARIGENAIVSVTEPTAALKLGTPIEVEFVDPLCFDAAGNRIAAEAAR